MNLLAEDGGFNFGMFVENAWWIITGIAIGIIISPLIRKVISKAANK